MLLRLARAADPGGSFLELGIGTGRIALPLLERGLTVAGIEASEQMIAELRLKPRGEEIEIVKGDYVRSRVGRRFSVVCLNFNGVFSPETREEQIECFENAARHLEPGGCFVVEAYVLRPEQLGGGWSVSPRFVRHEHVELQVSRHDAVTNQVERTMIHLRESGLRFVSVTDSYATPGELDLIARAAGLRLRDRFGGWGGESFGELCHKHVSVYEARRSPRRPTSRRPSR